MDSEKYLKNNHINNNSKTFGTIMKLQALS